ncbi:MAG: hypothetical protein ABFC73_14230 [Clostridiaceae bacterium]
MKRLVTMFVCVVLALLFFPTTALAATSPYYSNIKKSNITTDNVVITATINNPSKVKLIEGGFYVNTGSGSAIKKGTKMTDKISGSWQTAKSIPCSYNLRSGYRITLKENTTYYVLLYCKDIDGKIYYSEEISVLTAKAQSSTAKPDNNSTNLPPDAAPTNIGPFISNFDESLPNGNGGVHDGCGLNSMTMILNALGKRNANGDYLTPYDVAGEYTNGCPDFTIIEKKFDVKITGSDKLAKDFGSLSESEQETSLIEFLKALPQGQRALRVYFKLPSGKTHFIAVVLISTDKLVVYDPGLKSKIQVGKTGDWCGEGASYSETIKRYKTTARSFTLVELN